MLDTIIFLSYRLFLLETVLNKSILQCTLKSTKLRLDWGVCYSIGEEIFVSVNFYLCRYVVMAWRNPSFLQP